MSESNSYVNITHEQTLENFKARLNADERFKNLSSATVFQMFLEFLSGQFDFLNFYLGRTAEEQFFDTAKLPASFIKLAHNLGYAPKRPIPAEATVAIKLNGPLPSILNKDGAKKCTIWFNKDLFPLYYNGNKFMLDANYSYELTEQDIADGVDKPGWSKIIYFSRDKVGNYVQLGDDKKAYDLTELNKIKVIQGEIVTEEIRAQNNITNVGKNDQWYDINDVEFSNFYGERDPFSVGYDNEQHKENSVCKVGIGPNKDVALADENLYDIEVNSISLNKRFLKNDKENSRRLNICCIESNPDKTVRVRFGNGTTVSNGFTTKDDILYVQYLKTKGYAANKMGTANSDLKALSKIYGTYNGGSVDLSSNVKVVFTSDITNGKDFESNADIKNNAMLFYASGNKLVSREDFISYFTDLVKPILVKNAAIYTKKDYDRIGTYCTSLVSNSNTKLNKLNDTIGYCLLGDIYRSINDGNYDIINFYDPNCEDILTNTMYIDYTGFTQGIGDTFKLGYVPKSDVLTNSYQAAAMYVEGKVEDKLLPGVSLECVQPIIHYFDLDGEVVVEDSTNIAEYQTDVHNRIYKWLNENSSFNNKIFKSDLVKMFYDNKATKRVNVELKVSGLIKSDTACIDNLTVSDINGKQSTYSVAAKQDMTSNVLTVDSMDQNILALGNKTVTLIYGNATITSLVLNVTVVESSKLQIELLDNTGFTLTPNTKLAIYYPKENDFYSTAVPDENGKFSGRLTAKSNIEKIFAEIKNHVDAMDVDGNPKTLKSSTYFGYEYTNGTSLNSINTYSNIETSYGWNNVNGDVGLNEMWFNFELPRQVQGIQSSEMATLLSQVYPKIKPNIEQNILDHNGNITNYSLPNEISVVRITVKPIFEFGADK